MPKKENGSSPLSVVSLRMDKSELQNFERIMDSAGLFTAEAIRHLVVRSVADYDKVDMTGLQFASEFTPKAPGRTNFPEHVGNLSITVTPPVGMSKAHLHQLIFILPEFIDDNSGDEVYRVDNYHFHRVVENNKHIASKKRSRAVLSFRLIKGRWTGSLFDYSGATAAQIVQEVVAKMELHIAATIKCELAGQLPTSRHLTPEEVAERDEFLMSYLVADYPS